MNLSILKYLIILAEHGTLDQFDDIMLSSSFKGCQSLWILLICLFNLYLFRCQEYRSSIPNLALESFILKKKNIDLESLCFQTSVSHMPFHTKTV